MSSTTETAEGVEAPLSRAVGLMRRLFWVYGLFAVALGLFLLPAALPIKRLAKLKGLAAELVRGGLGVTAFDAVLLVLIVLFATAMVARARLARRVAETAALLGEFDPTPPSLFGRLWKVGPGVLARQGQAILLTLGAVLVWLLAWLMWPSLKVPAADPTNAHLMAALVIALSFPSLIAERMVAGFPAEQLPEAPGLRRLLLIVTVLLAVAGLAEIGRSLGFAWVAWVQRALLVLLVLLAVEFALRALGRLFLPTPSPETAQAVSESVIATLLTSGPKAPGVLIRTHLGLDFARSWALSFLSAAALPALVLTLLFCWALSGVKLLDGDQRGVYERLGAPIKVLGPGFHILPPWPLGRLRPVDYGAIYTIAVGARGGPDALSQEGKGQRPVGVEDNPDASMNRLWDTAHPTEAEYLVANEAASGQSFQAVNAEILVLYRTGLTDAAAMQAVYGAESQSVVVQREAARLATRYFSSHTLDGVMGGQRERLQEDLRVQLQRAVDADRVGVDIVGVLIDAIHPPAGAAAAYHAVQAAQIKADASIAQATAHATRTAGKAQQEAHQALTAAQAVATEKVHAANGDAYQFAADRQAYHVAAGAFLQERRARSLVPALKGARLTIVDHRLAADQTPFIDMRGAPAPAAPAPSSGSAAPTPEQSEAFDPALAAAGLQ